MKNSFVNGIAAVGRGSNRRIARVGNPGGVARIEPRVEARPEPSATFTLAMAWAGRNPGAAAGHRTGALGGPEPGGGRWAVTPPGPPGSAPPGPASIRPP